MIASAPIPDDEEARLAALRSYCILDTEPDSRFDLFPRLCTWLYKVPVAAINLVDAERTCFKSLIGFPSYEPRRETSMCAHAVGEGNPIMVIDDMRKDPRFADHPLVAKGLVFYAGALVCSSAGHALGTLCIGDIRPRVFTPDDRNKLMEMAAGVGAVLELHRTTQTLRHIADRDPLTGLYNRRAFTASLNEAIQSVPAGKNYALLYLDLDHFKPVNDTYGHAAGDAILQEVGQRLAKTVRGQDIVARLGGDEFAILFEAADPRHVAEAMSRRILESFAEPVVYEGCSLAVATSIGIVVVDNHVIHPSAEYLTRWADEALYVAKRAGRSQFVILPP